MTDETFIDYYELMELSPQANFETIEVVARYLTNQFQAQKSDPDKAQYFTRFVAAYETLSDPELRAAYDESYERKKKLNSVEELDNESSSDDVAERLVMLRVMYAQRRKNVANPGVGITRLEELIDAPVEAVAFNVWFLTEKGFVQREESGLLSITANGVEQIDLANEQLPVSEAKILENESELATAE